VKTKLLFFSLCTFISEMRILLLIFSLLLHGCASIQGVKELEGQGTKKVFNAPYEKVWDAALKACQTSDIEIVESNKDKGLISAKTSVRATSWGENIAVWVKKVSEIRTEVEVVSRKAGPALLFYYNWEEPILNNIEKQIQ
jgi:hypothetical protein